MSDLDLTELREIAVDNSLTDERDTAYPPNQKENDND